MGFSPLHWGSWGVNRRWPLQQGNRSLLENDIGQNSRGESRVGPREALLARADFGGGLGLAEPSLC